MNTMFMSLIHFSMKHSYPIVLVVIMSVSLFEH